MKILSVVCAIVATGRTGAAYAILSFETREKAAPKAAGPSQQKGSHLRDPGSPEERLGEGLKIEGRLRLRVPSAPAPSGGPTRFAPDPKTKTKKSFEKRPRKSACSLCDKKINTDSNCEEKGYYLHTHHFKP